MSTDKLTREELEAVAEKYAKVVEQRTKAYNRRAVRQSLIIEKAIQAGIVVTDVEVDKELARRESAKKSK